jgi:hypothetical protein
MKTLWCWRCGQEMPMLDEGEYGEALRIYNECAQDVKAIRRKSNLSLADANVDERFRPLREWYERLTGVPGCHQDAILHHRLSRLGSPCGACGKSLRSPRAKRCVSCGTAVA